MAALLKKRALAEYSQVVQESPKPLKKLRLAKKVVTGGSAAAYVGLLEKCKSSNDALQILLRISDSMKFQEEELSDAVQKLSDHYLVETESAVRAKILCLYGDMITEASGDFQSIVDVILQLIKKETSHKVLAQGISALLKLGRLSDSTAFHQKLVFVAKQYLCDTSHLVKCRCLELIGELQPLGTGSGGSGGSGGGGGASAGVGDASAQAVLRLVGDYTHSEEARVRSAAFRTMITLHGRGLRLDPALYSEVCVALKDDYEIVRRAALQLVWILGNTYPDHMVSAWGSTEGGGGGEGSGGGDVAGVGGSASGSSSAPEEQVRLVDDAFGRLCSCINDLSLHVRVQAAHGLGSMQAVSHRFLMQTLDKKLMSNMRKKRSAHERAWEQATSGEWSSGKAWADDAPRELVDADAVSLISTGSCGAFVHGLEDEFMEVRNASVESLCQLSLHNPQFAAMSLDFLVDMFNDEIEGVRLKAIDSLTRISQHCLLREDQLEIILGALKDFSIDIREGLHKMLGACRLSSKGCLQMCVESLLENLKKYPVDKKSTWRCLQRIGQAHPELTLALVPELLAIHPFLDMPEVDVEEPSYISILILVFNAAQHCPTMLQLFEESTLKHYCYLRDTMPTLVPALKVRGRGLVSPATAPPPRAEEGAARARRLLAAVLARAAAAPAGRLREELLLAAERDLRRLAAAEGGEANGEGAGGGGGGAAFAAAFVEAQLLAAKALAARRWANPHALVAHQGALVRSAIAQLLQRTLRLQYLFLGLGDREIAAVKQFRLLVLALQLVYVVRGSNVSALALTEHFLEQCDEAAKFLCERGVSAEPFCSAALRELSALEEAKPGAVARRLLPLLLAAAPAPPPLPAAATRATRAVLQQPCADADHALKFTAGLVVGLPLDAEIRNLAHPNLLRVKVKYPDQQTQLLVPKRSDLRPLEPDTLPTETASAAGSSSGVCKAENGTSANSSSSEAPTDFRLLTTVLISHQVWTEACTVDVSLALDLSEREAGLFWSPGGSSGGGRRTPTGGGAGGGSAAATPADLLEPCVLDLCKPVKVYVSPKPVKRGL